ncbi:uncharacterized protein SPAPADRAFT_61617 [Spathaspora passalidarum NRRL Y-27907]|uniref:BAR domain-containing protein n=1 Tax=Spathaspora passalidarum (strain NRRL Y-27907 / 11-Y1) TaxID=619300 RepID=G3ANM3_SPAPN|nr:uncharacterized protein SPAPADRAFT_61617 [Spathaspora passalidarum NRRL Y-27907]EGW32552.1 hypothetical protein SPAPADRAFT_61617 [Spathaspora passalidarum NRRL Y-27907]
MSWIGIKKAINRAGTQVMLKTGHIEQTIDKDYDFEEKRYRTLEASSLKLQKQLRNYSECLKLVTNSQINVAEALSSFYGTTASTAKPKEANGTGEEDNQEQQQQQQQEEAAKFESLSQEYYHTLLKLNSDCVANFEQPYNQTVLNPIARFNSYYIEINDAIKRRTNKQLDYDAMKNKLKKLMEKPQLDPSFDQKVSETASEADEAERAYSEINDQLKRELPKLVSLRVPYFDPSFEAFVKIQTRFFGESYRVLNGLQGKLDARTREDYVSGKLDKRVDEVLDKMRALEL